LDCPMTLQIASQARPPYSSSLPDSWLQGDSEEFQVCTQQSLTFLLRVSLWWNKRCQGNTTVCVGLRSVVLQCGHVFNHMHIL